MPNDDKPKKLPKDGDGESSGNDDALYGLNSPDLSEDGKPQNKAVASFKQAHSICKRQYDRAEEGRLRTASIIASKYGGDTPYRQADLNNTGQGWRNNFSTNPLASVVDRATPQLKDPTKQAEVITYSSLSPSRQNANDKSRKFRKRTTKLIRTWSAWEDTMDMVTQDNYLFGNTAPGWIDDDWRPKAFRTNEVFLPEGSGQHASQLQMVIYRQPMLLHDFIQKIRDTETAKDAGYDMEGCVKAANEAAGLRHQGTDLSNFERVDQIREGGQLGYTYEGDTKIVWLFHLLVREYEGGVDLWTTSQKGGHAIRHVEGIHEKMEDACALFTLQSGNNRLYGSKGAGRMLTNLHIALDRQRNNSADKAFVAGMPIGLTKAKDTNSIQMHVRQPFIFLTGDVQLSTESIVFNPEVEDYMDKSLSGLMEAVAGAFIPPKITNEGSSNTKIEAAEKAARELAVRNGVLGRFFRQFGDLVSAMQRKIYKPENLKEALRIFEEQQKRQQKTGIRMIPKKLWDWIKSVVTGIDKTAQPMEESKTADAEAVEAIVDLLNDGLDVEEIAELALSPAANQSTDQPEEQDQKISGFIGAISGSPLAPYFDHQKMAEMASKIAAGEDVTDQILLKSHPDPNNQAINTREELSEWITMMQGDPVGAASTDDHRVRRLVLATKLHPIIETLANAPTPELIKLGLLAVPHYAQHLEMDQETPPDQKAQEANGVQMWEDTVIAAQKHVAALAQQAAKAGVVAGPNGLPPTLNGAPPGASGPGGTLQGTQGDLEREKLNAEDRRTQADAMVKVGQLKLQHRKLDIEQQKLGMQEEQHTLDTALENTKSIAEAAAQSHQAGIDDAKNDVLQQDQLMAAQQAQGQPIEPDLKN